jgi:hypothetical protein
MDWQTMLDPLRTSMDEMMVTYFRDPFIGLAILFTLPGLMLGVLNAVTASKVVHWLLGKLVALSAFFMIVGAVSCFIPVDRGLFFTRSQAIIGSILVALVWGFVIGVHKWSPRSSRD